MVGLELVAVRNRRGLFGVGRKQQRIGVLLHIYEAIWGLLELLCQRIVAAQVGHVVPAIFELGKATYSGTTAQQEQECSVEAGALEVGNRAYTHSKQVVAL